MSRPILKRKRPPKIRPRTFRISISRPVFDPVRFWAHGTPKAVHIDASIKKAGKYREIALPDAINRIRKLVPDYVITVY